MNSKISTIVNIVIIIGLLLAIFYVVSDIRNPEDNSGDVSLKSDDSGVLSENSDGTELDNGGEVGDFENEKNNHYKNSAEIDPGDIGIDFSKRVLDTSIASPSLDFEIKIPERYKGTKAAESLIKRIDDSRDQIRADATDLGAWFDLALILKGIDHYEEARDIWEYVNQTNPNNSVSFGNLGDLYHLYLKDYAKSEENYLMAIKNEPTRIGLYRGLHDLYKYDYKKETRAAIDILEQGLEVFPEHPDLLVLLGKHYSDQSLTDMAREYYEMAKSAAEGLGNHQLVNLIDMELKNL